jgi:hypothetical protein
MDSPERLETSASILSRFIRDYLPTSKPTRGYSRLVSLVFQVLALGPDAPALPEAASAVNATPFSQEACHPSVCSGACIKTELLQIGSLARASAMDKGTIVCFFSTNQEHEYFDATCRYEV